VKRRNPGKMRQGLLIAKCQNLPRFDHDSLKSIINPKMANKILLKKLFYVSNSLKAIHRARHGIVPTRVGVAKSLFRTILYYVLLSAIVLLVGTTSLVCEGYSQ
jgi:hypothetical protein